MRNEPLIEIKQTKGQSETHPALSPNDEFADYEIWSVLLGDPAGRIPHIVGSYARQALKDGLALQDVNGFNPYKFGFGAASDSHSTATPYMQNNYFGTLGAADGTIQQRMSGTVLSGIDVRTAGPAGLTGVWAEENTRASIFNAMQRKETFAVSGPHIKVRFFGGWDYAAGETADQLKEFWKNTPDWVKDANWLKAAYDGGVPVKAQNRMNFGARRRVSTSVRQFHLPLFISGQSTPRAAGLLPAPVLPSEGSQTNGRFRVAIGGGRTALIS